MSTILESRPARLVAAGALVSTAALMVVSTVTQPRFPADTTERLAAIAEAGNSAVVSIVAFTLSQLPFLIGVVAIAALAVGRARKTAVVGGVLATLGGFGHTVFGGIGLSHLAMADAPHRETMGEVVGAIESGPAAVFMAMGLLGTVLGLLVLGIALFRSHAVPRWIPIALWVFLVVEFLGANLSEWASPTAGAIYLAAFTGIGLELLKTPHTAVSDATGPTMSNA